MVEELPKVEINNEYLVSAKRVIAIADFLPIEVFGRTTLKKNSYNKIYCTYCNETFSDGEREAAHFKYCPYCGLKIEECIF